jgi:hypothetical protein
MVVVAEDPPYFSGSVRGPRVVGYPMTLPALGDTTAWIKRAVRPEGTTGPHALTREGDVKC